MQKRLLGWKRDPVDHRDLKYMARGSRKLAVLPTEVLNEEFVRPILSQEWEDCVANGYTGAVSALDRARGGPGKRISRHAVYYYSGAFTGDQKNDNGRFPRDAYKAGQLFGWPDEELWPYDQEHAFREPTVDTHPSAYARRLVFLYERIPQGANMLYTLQRAIMDKEFPTIGTQVTRAFCDNIGTRETVTRPGETAAVAGGHLMYLCGYTTLRNGRVLFRGVNSWGEDWGDHGLFWMDQDYVTWQETGDLMAARRGIPMDQAA